MKNWKFIIGTLLITMLIFSVSKETQAQEKHTIAVLKVQEETGKMYTSDIIVETDSEGNANVYLEESDFSFVNDKSTMMVSVTLDIVDHAFFENGTVQFNKQVSVNAGESVTETITWNGDFGNGLQGQSISYNISSCFVDIEVESFVTSAAKKGFHPSKGNYLIFRSVLNAEVKTMDEYYLNLRFRILDSKGRCVYKKIYQKVGRGLYLNLHWDGKSSKNCDAGIAKKAYVKNGTYKAEIVYEFEGLGEKKSAKRTTQFKVSRKALKGTKGLAQAKDIITLTGDAEIDYMAEKMVKAAGVKISMSDEQKVKKIYHYMTKKFKHTHYATWEDNYKIYYDVDKLAGKIAKYKAKTDRQLKKGELIYNYQYFFNTSWCMQRRRGVCDDHAEIFAILLNHVGVESGKCGGYYLNRDGSKMGHAWNYAIVNGKKYYYDVDVEMQNLGKGQGDYYWYKKTKKQAKKNHEFTYEN